ncbi:MAG: S24/S26 family peptidase [Candidatus Sulfotelmatobacter sp.]
MLVFAPSAPGLRDDPRLDLSLEILRHGTIRLAALGTSMLPSIWPGDVLTIEPLKHAQIVPGDIVLILRNNRVLIHRVVETRETNGCRVWTTRGDSMPQGDPPATDSDLLGKVIAIDRGDRTFTPNRKISILDYVLARTFCRCDRIRSLALRIHAAGLRRDSAGSGDLAKDVSGATYPPYISLSSGSHV